MALLADMQAWNATFQLMIKTTIYCVKSTNWFDPPLDTKFWPALCEVLNIKNLSDGTGSKQVSFEIQKGELSTLGPSGSGKTTLMQCINGLSELQMEKFF